MSPRLLIVLLLALALPAHAAAQRSRAAEPVAELSRCRGIPESATRLACYDQAADSLTRAIAAKQVVVLDRDDVRKTRRSLFGFTLPQLPFFGGGNDEPPEAKEIKAKLASARELGYGKWRVRLEEGAVWETTEAVSGSTPEAGQEVSIRKAALGSYFLKFGSTRAVRAKRVN